VSAYYNEFDPYAAQWLRNLIKAGLIADGIVDERSIVEVEAGDLKGFVQCHFFAGIGGWSHALRLAGWPDDRPVWTGSPPCQPFSTAGLQKGIDDERHLAPVWLELIKEGKPENIFGEQVAAAIAKDNWLDDLQDELENQGYATGEIVLPACGLGSPHIRQRLWLTATRVGNTEHAGLERHLRAENSEKGRPQPNRSGESAGMSGRLANTEHDGPSVGEVGRDIEKASQRCQERSQLTVESEGSGRPKCNENLSGRERCDGGSAADNALSLASFWRDADWLGCRDGRFRPVEPGTFPLANGVSNRVGRLRAYGNAIVPQVAAEVIKTVMEFRP